MNIPRSIESLDSIARQCGMMVEMAVEPYPGETDLRLWSKWRGTRAQFLGVVQPVRSYRLPLSSGTVHIPRGRSSARNALAVGVVTIMGDAVLFKIDWGPLDFRIVDIAGVEVIRSADEVLYHGQPEALVRLGIEQSRLPLGKKTAKHCIDWESPREAWLSRRQPDGSIVYRTESPAALRRRHAELGPAPFGSRKPRPMYVRLVVDNPASPKLRRSDPGKAPTDGPSRF